MQWREKWDANKDRVYSTEEAVRHHINNRPDYHAGQIESLRAEIDALTDWVSRLVEYLPEHAQREIVSYMTGMKEEK